MKNDRENAAYYHKALFALRITRYLVAVIFIVFILCCIFFFRSDITLENIQYLMKYADFYENTDIPDSAEIYISADNDSQVFALRDNLTVVSRSGVGLYEFSGHKLFNYPLSYSNPGVAHDDRNILIYDITGNELSIFNSFSRVYTQKYPYSVKAGCINENGFAIITNEKTYRSVVIVYNSKFEEICKVKSATRYVTNVDLAQDGSKIVTTAVTSKNGSYNTLVNVTDVRTGKILYSVEIPEELGLQTGFSNDGNNIYVITDSMLRFYNHNLKETSSFKYNQTKTEKYFVENEKIVLAESNNLSGSSMTLIGFDFSGKQIFNINTEEKITSVSCGKEKLYALSNRNLYAYAFKADGSLEFLTKIPSDGDSKAVICDKEDRFIITSTKKAVRASIDSVLQQQNNDKVKVSK